MASGLVRNWNGNSGWIKPFGIADLPTALAQDVMILSAQIQSGTIIANLTASSAALIQSNSVHQNAVQSGTVTYTTAASEPWIARSVVITLT